MCDQQLLFAFSKVNNWDIKTLQYNKLIVILMEHEVGQVQSKEQDNIIHLESRAWGGSLRRLDELNKAPEYDTYLNVTF